jgi:hypothetical protein
MPRYNQPERGTTNWDEPLNENFANLEFEVTNEVATFSDLPNPTGEMSANGMPRKYLVQESRTIFRETGESWEAIAGLGNEGSPVPGMSSFENVRTDSFYTVEGTTVSDIADAVANHQYVKLQPGMTYTHDGSSTISHSRGNGDTVIDAHGANIEVRGIVVDVDETSERADSFAWYGGRFLGSNSPGELAFDVSDSVFNVFHPHEIRDCEGGMFFYNEDLWCEFNDVSFKGKNNDTSIALIGNDGSSPPGSSFRDPEQNGGTRSFRSFDLNLRLNPRANHQSTSYGVYMSESKPYTCDWNVTVSGDQDCIGLRMHSDGGFPGTRILYHYETPGGHSGGIGIQVDKYPRAVPQMIARVAPSADQYVVNNTTHPLVTIDNAVQNRENGTFGPQLRIDGEVVERFTDLVGDPGGKIIRIPYQFPKGTRDDPAIQLGSNGAGFFVNSSGEVIVVDESGNTSRLT